jgi:small neutral amino acid transporter SnatA (MarC family)
MHAFYIVVLSTVFLTDLLKAKVAIQMRRYVTPSRFKILHRISGIGLIAFGIRLIVNVTI